MKILRTKQVLESLDVSESTLHRWRKAGRFPEPIQLGPHSVGWLEEDVRSWLEEHRQSQEDAE